MAKEMRLFFTQLLRSTKSQANNKKESWSKATWNFRLRLFSMNIFEDE